MTTQKPSMPFPPNAVSDRDRIIESGVERLRDQHRANVAAHKLAFAEECESAWHAYESKRKSDWITKYHESHYIPLKYPHSGLDREGQYRVSLPYESRIEGLAAVKLYGQMLYVLLARTPGHKTTVGQVKSWLRPYLPEVDGNMMIISRRGSRERSYVAEATTSTNDLIHAEGLSQSLADLLNYTTMIQAEFNTVSWLAPDEFEASDY